MDIQNQTLASQVDILTLHKLLSESANDQFILSVSFTLIITFIFGFYFYTLSASFTNKIEKNRKKVEIERRKKAHDFIASRLSRIQNALDLQQQNLDAIDAGKASPGITREGLNIAIWRDALQANYKDIKFVFLSNIVHMPPDADIDELDNLLHTNPLLERMIQSNGIQNIEQIIEAIRDLIKKLE